MVNCDCQDEQRGINKGQLIITVCVKYCRYIFSEIATFVVSLIKALGKALAKHGKVFCEWTFTKGLAVSPIMTGGK